MEGKKEIAVRFAFVYPATLASRGDEEADELDCETTLFQVVQHLVTYNRRDAVRISKKKHYRKWFNHFDKLLPGFHKNVQSTFSSSPGRHTSANTQDR